MKRIRLIGILLLSTLITTPAWAGSAPTGCGTGQETNMAMPCTVLANVGTKNNDSLPRSDVRRQSMMKLLLIMHAVARQAR